jgi:hypothetical protein
MGASEKKNEIELVPDAWPRFEKFIRDIAKAGPQHRAPAAKPITKESPKATPKKRACKEPVIEE